MKKMTKSLFVVFVGLFAFVATITQAQDKYPSKPIRIVVPWGTGGSPDIFNRMVANSLEARIGQRVLVENRAGANGIVGTNHVARSVADGYTVLYASNSGISAARALVKTLQYDPINDFAGVTIVQEGYNVLVVRSEDKGLTFPRFLERLRKDPERYSIGGTSTTAEVSNALMSSIGKLTHTYIRYKDTPTMMNDLLGGRLAAAFSPIGSMMQSIQQGQIFASGVTAPARLPVLPNTPAIAESLPGATVSVWVGYMVPAKTPKPVIDYLYEKISLVLKEPAILKWNEDAGRALFMKPDEVDAFVRKDELHWQALFQAAGIKPQ